MGKQTNPSTFHNFSIKFPENNFYLLKGNCSAKYKMESKSDWHIISCRDQDNVNVEEMSGKFNVKKKTSF